jgi:hypothetical protein
VDTNNQLEQAKLAHAKEMLLVNYIGAVIVISVLGLVGTMAGLTIWAMNNPTHDVGIILGIFGTVGGVITTGLAYLAPSPLQSSSRRSSDTGTPAGTPADPISTNEVSSQGAQPLAVPTNHNAKADPLPVDITPDDDDLKADATGELTEHDFEPSEPVKRGDDDTLDAAYTEEEPTK